MATIAVFPANASPIPTTQASPQPLSACGPARFAWASPASPFPPYWGRLAIVTDLLNVSPRTGNSFGYTIAFTRSAATSLPPNPRANILIARISLQVSSHRTGPSDWLCTLFGPDPASQLAGMGGLVLRVTRCDTHAPPRLVRSVLSTERPTLRKSPLPFFFSFVSIVKSLCHCSACSLPDTLTYIATNARSASL